MLNSLTVTSGKSLVWKLNRTIDPLMYNLLYSLADDMIEEFKHLEDISEQQTEREREEEKCQVRAKWVLVAKGFYEIRWGLSSLVCDEETLASRRTREWLDNEFSLYMKCVWPNVPGQIRCSLQAEARWTSVRKRF